jgi:hypothetical protein
MYADYNRLSSYKPDPNAAPNNKSKIQIAKPEVARILPQERKNTNLASTRRTESSKMKPKPFDGKNSESVEAVETLPLTEGRKLAVAEFRLGRVRRMRTKSNSVIQPIKIRPPSAHNASGVDNMACLQPIPQKNFVHRDPAARRQKIDALFASAKEDFLTFGKKLASKKLDAGLRYDLAKASNAIVGKLDEYSTENQDHSLWTNLGELTKTLDKINRLIDRPLVEEAMDPEYLTHHGKCRKICSL